MTNPDLSAVMVALFKGVLYRNEDPPMWESLLGLQARAREFVTVLGLQLLIDEAEGYAFLRAREENEDEPKRPRLVARRPLSFPVSLILALLRKKLAELDTGGGETRLVMTRDELVDLVLVFQPEHTNEAKLVEQLEAHLNKIVQLGFLRPMKTQSGPPSFEVMRILKAYVDAQWLANLDERLAAYRAELEKTDE